MTRKTGLNTIPLLIQVFSKPCKKSMYAIPDIPLEANQSDSKNI